LQACHRRLWIVFLLLDPRLTRGAFARLGFVATLGLACVLAAIGPSDAELGEAPATPSCSFSYEQASARGRAAVKADPTPVFTDYGGNEAARSLATINATPPATEYLAEHVLTLEMPDDDPVVVLVHDGCVAMATRGRMRIGKSCAAARSAIRREPAAADLS
jgi:hypothetical protein